MKIEDDEMLELTDHKVNPANDKLVVKVTDEPGAGGANHRYEISGFDNIENNPSAPTWIKEYVAKFGHSPVFDILFQNGPIGEAGVNGITQEVLLAIVADRLRSFQAGRFACRENAVALTKIEEAQMWLNKRTMDRMRRGVEGTHKQ